MLLYDDSFNRIDTLLLDVKPDDDVYLVTGESLGINKINLTEHTQRAIKYKDAGRHIYSFLNRNYHGDKITVVGKNVYFDLTHLWDKLIGRSTWEQFCSYQVVDITAIWKYLEITGKVAKLPKTSLSNLCEYFGFCDKPDHTAYQDAFLTFEVFRKICQL